MIGALVCLERITTIVLGYQLMLLRQFVMRPYAADAIEMDADAASVASLWSFRAAFIDLEITESLLKLMISKA